ncbi:hypothetical protein EYC84_012035 [Monilinia fructicola]|uniref:Uncharacterized protein n=1 Tax=Monilinia fructicola TaxID=38448 RepID=A0A5M9J4Z9_MONFR|nr:hypothetical protein EYC84_012035 [Monilinia fructicola]
MILPKVAIWAAALSLTVSTVLSENNGGNLSDKVARSEEQAGLGKRLLFSSNPEDDSIASLVNSQGLTDPSSIANFLRSPGVGLDDGSISDFISQLFGGSGNSGSRGSNNPGSPGSSPGTNPNFPGGPGGNNPVGTGNGGSNRFPQFPNFPGNFGNGGGLNNPGGNSPGGVGNGGGNGFPPFPKFPNFPGNLGNGGNPNNPGGNNPGNNPGNSPGNGGGWSPYTPLLQFLQGEGVNPFFISQFLNGLDASTVARIFT